MRVLMSFVSAASPAHMHGDLPGRTPRGGPGWTRRGGSAQARRGFAKLDHYRHGFWMAGACGAHSISVCFWMCKAFSYPAWRHRLLWPAGVFWCARLLHVVGPSRLASGVFSMGYWLAPCVGVLG